MNSDTLIYNTALALQWLFAGMLVLPEATTTAVAHTIEAVHHVTGTPAEDPSKKQDPRQKLEIMVP